MQVNSWINSPDVCYGRVLWCCWCWQVAVESENFDVLLLFELETGSGSLDFSLSDVFENRFLGNDVNRKSSRWWVALLGQLPNSHPECAQTSDMPYTVLVSRDPYFMAYEIIPLQLGSIIWSLITAQMQKKEGKPLKHTFPKTSLPPGHLLFDNFLLFVSHVMAIQPTPLTYPPRNKGLIAGLIKGNQSLISPDHKGPRLFLGGGTWR